MRDNLYTRKKVFLIGKFNSRAFKVSNIFIDCQVLTCNFHREQAWERWLNATKNRAKKDDYRYSTL